MAKHTVTLIPGDGIGEEVTLATRKIIDATGVSINWEMCEAGAAVFKKGLGTGVPQETIDSILKNKVALKGPLETPVGFGEKSANVTLRKLFETYANIRPVREIPGVKTPYSGRNLDLVVVRENVEDLYAGIEHMQSPNVAQCLKIISRNGCEKIVRMAFEFARSEGRKKIHCATKSNIMKLSEGMLKRTFEEIAPEYPDIEANHIIVDNCAHQLVKSPEQFDIILTTNMNGDILSDLTSALIGGLGFAASSNLGDDVCIFEAVHGSAPKYAGKNVINPTAVLSAGIMMLRYLGEFEAARLIENAVYVTLDHDKKLPQDVAKLVGASPISTTDYTSAVIANLGKNHDAYVERNYQPIKKPTKKVPISPIVASQRKVAGVDIFIETNTPIKEVGDKLKLLTDSTALKLKLISNRGVVVYPSLEGTTPDLIDICRCRFVVKTEGANASDQEISVLINQISEAFNWVHIEKLHDFDGKMAYSKAHGED
jgi:isocitrate dehydrogenase